MLVSVIHHNIASLELVTFDLNTLTIQLDPPFLHDFLRFLIIEALDEFVCLSNPINTLGLGDSCDLLHRLEVL
jgi:hypothetical protein